MSETPNCVTVINPIKFGTDGWRGLIAADFTFERLVFVAPLAAQVLKETYGPTTGSNTIVVGYDRRFLSEDFAMTAAKTIQVAGFDVLLSECFAPTPTFSWASKAMNVLGAFVITASHNPGGYSGFKMKGAFGGSVPSEVTAKVEALIANPPAPQQDVQPGTFATFNPWISYCEGLRKLVDVDAIKTAIAADKIRVFVDVMHGAASTGLSQLLGMEIPELNANRDPLFGGGAPEPLPKYLPELLQVIPETNTNAVKVGLVFDGDCDRIAAVDGNGKFLSSQILIPILIEHLSQRKGYSGEVVKTVSGSGLIAKTAELFGLSVFETPIGYKYIADRMLESKALLGGEESGGIGYGHHIPERDALLAALYVLEVVVATGQDLSDLHQAIQTKTGFDAAYDRIDMPLASMAVRDALLNSLKNSPIQTVAGKAVVNTQTDDGYKFRLEDESWLLVRFSGTEPVLRLYCEAATIEQVHSILNWAKDWAIAV